MFRNVVTRQDHVRDPPAPRDRGEDRPQREERVQVALVDARRHDEEGEREDRQRRRGASAGRAGRATTPQTTTNANASSAAPIDDRRDRPEDLEARRAVGAAGHRVGDDRVADPRPGLREAVAVELDERPRVVGVDGDVRVAGRGREDLLEQPGAAAPFGPISMTDSPNGSERTTAVTRPARPVVRIRIGWPVRRSQPAAGRGSRRPAAGRRPRSSRGPSARARAGSSRPRRSGRGSRAAA